MSYQALYRVWRPQTFDELVGQDMIGQTLRNAIKNNQLSHAYLFAGPRGTGKTSAAKILAKAVNCPYSEDGNPCNECETCRGIQSGEISDVIEIDAASNNGVDEIRDLRDKVRYAPTVAENKVYIIDEVHMLTTGAFNALLKTLEEPPAHVFFIMATTEPHKIPATILSRTQRFDFQRIQDDDLVGRMEHILNYEKKEYEAEALAIIARASNGGMRDSLSLLDQALSFSNQKVDTEVALLVSGSFAQTMYKAYIQALYNEETAKALELLAEQFQEGKQAHRFIEELILFSRDVLLSLYSGKNQTLLTENEFEPLKNNIDPDYYYLLIDYLNQAQNQMRFSSQPEVYLEVMTVQLSQAKSAPLHLSASTTQEEVTAQATSPGPVMDEVRRLEEQLSALQQQLTGQQKIIADLNKKLTSQEAGFTFKESSQAKVDAPVDDPADTEEELVPREKPRFAPQEYQVDLHHIYDVLNRATRQHLAAARHKWEAILADLNPQQRAKLTGTKPLAAGPNAVLIAFNNQVFCAMVQYDQELKDILANLASRHLNESVHFTFIVEEDWARVRQNYKLLFDQNKGAPVPLPEPLADFPSNIKVDNPAEVSDEEEKEKPENQTEIQSQTTEPFKDHSPSVLTQATESTAEESSTGLASIKALVPEAASNVAELFGRSQQNQAENDENQAEETEEIPQAEGQIGFFETADSTEDYLKKKEMNTKDSRDSGSLESEEAAQLTSELDVEKMEIIQKAVDLFGNDKVNIYLDR